MHQNIQCLSNKILPLEVTLAKNNIDILLLTEHWLLNDQIKSINMSNYFLASSFTRSNSIHGGTAIFCISDKYVIKTRSVDQFCIEGVFECSCIEITNLNIIVIAIYRPPLNAKYNIFLETLSNLLENMCSNRKSIVLGGDFNIDFLMHNEHETLHLTDLLSTYGFVSTIASPTRKASRRCIDNFLINSQITDYHTNNINLHLSDHLSQFIFIKLSSAPIENVKKFYFIRKINSENTARFCSYLKAENWQYVYSQSCPNLAFKNFLNIVSYYFDLSFPQIRVSGNQKNINRNKWLTQDLLELRDRVCLLSDLSQKYPELRNTCKNLNIEYKNRLSVSKRNYYDNIINSSSNKMKCMWKVINELQNKKVTENEIKITDNGSQLSDLEIANKFNIYFTSHNQDTTNEDYQFLNDNIPMYEKSFFLSPVSELEVISYINRLKPSNSSGYDHVSNNLLKQCKFELSSPLVFLINMCYETGVFPDILKLTKVIPLHKKGDPNICSNYRGISLISSFSKVLEIAMTDQLVSYFYKNNILSSTQHGFTKNKSVTTALFEFHNLIVNAVEKKIHPYGLFIDFSRAFDCVNHKLLLTKLFRYGVRGPVLNLFNSYLDNRNQIVEVNGGIKSDSCKIRLGVPQGSVLGPFLFLIFANDLISFIKQTPNVHIVCYADDTNFLVTGKDFGSSLNTVNIIYSKIILWSEKNFLNLNKDKTISVIFKQNNISVRDNLNLQESVKMLGVTFQSDLGWFGHIDNLCDKLKKCCYALRCLKTSCSQKILLTLYYANIHSQLRYGILIWGTSHCAQRAFIIQKYAVRIIMGLNKFDSCRSSFKDLKILTVANIYIYEICCFVFANKSIFLANQVNHDHLTRYKNNFLSDQHSTSLYQKGAFFNGCKIFNSLPEELKHTSNVFIFKKRLRALLLEKNCYTIGEFF